MWGPGLLENLAYRMTIGDDRGARELLFLLEVWPVGQEPYPNPIFLMGKLRPIVWKRLGRGHLDFQAASPSPSPSPLQAS